MPIYEYQCQEPQEEACSEVFEKMRPHSKRDECPECPHCQGPTRRKVSRSSFQLKGGGWYKDGYSG